MRVRGYAPGTPCWAMLSGGDVAGHATFYGGVFGWEHTGGRFHRDGLAVAGTGPALPGPAGTPPGWLTCIATDDIATCAAAVVEAGGAVLQPAGPAEPGGRYTVLADPAGAVFGAWQRETFAGAQLVSEPGAVCWSDLATRDAGQAEAFYAKAFDWSCRPGEIAGLEYHEWTCAGRVVAGMVPLPATVPLSVPPRWQTTIEVDEIRPVLARAENLGGFLLRGPIDVQVGWYAQLLDPQGGAFAVIELVPWLRTLG